MKKTTGYVLGVVVLAGVLGFAYYAISPLFIKIKVNDVLPGQETREGSTPATSQEAPDETPAMHPVSVLVVDTPAHPASGSVRLVEAGGKTYVRYENYKTINGPDIYVYLAKDIEAKEFVNLGRVKATEGNINYEIPVGVDVARYPYVLTWCKQFGVLFNYANLSQTL